MLVGLTSVDAEAEVHLDGLVELGGRDLGGEACGLERSVQAVLLELGRRLAIALSVLGHGVHPFVVNGPARPSHIARHRAPRQ